MRTISLTTWVALGLAMAGLVALGWLWRRHGQRVVVFLNEVVGELKKCSWPWEPQEKGARRYRELIDSTVVVAISSVLLAAVVTLADFLLVKVVGFLTRLQL
ncbi:Preprotein translocase subunit SecE [Methylacidimicrobium sp. AP8]|uniref:preprotein translocase subunit SecE n=1 Tax=Methylacidimicrobium sp. AP8 TaxID=2730359 RepID=UPI0018C05388|nr:preprotein translocase subunit SecE [Methylacidimicrobium sp. AP8]CAB4243051.1 Preprotein translocase subunit SecE [Methylacidimicrobium sp. AP8]